MKYKKNGHIHNGKQNHQCKACGRQFVQCSDQYLIGAEQRALIERLHLERISLRGICRAVGVGLKWLLGFIVNCFEALPDHLHVQPIAGTQDVILHRLDVEADEMCSFVGKKVHKPWIWIAMDMKTRQVIAFHVGNRSRKSAKALWKKIPEAYRAQATFYTDQYEAYKGVIPAVQHKAITTTARKTNHIERFKNTLRQRASRLVRETLSFSKKLANHIGCHQILHLPLPPHESSITWIALPKLLCHRSLLHA